MTQAAIYARKSTEQRDVGDADKSVSRQVDLARGFATSKGWTVADELVFVDDGISGVATVKLVARARMLAAAADEQFAHLIVRDLDRLGRNDEELPGLIYTLRDAGVQVWSYSDGQLVETSSALQRGMLSMRATFAGAEREAAQHRTREQKRSRAAQGRLADGRVLGYRTVGPSKDRRREIDPEQAPLVRRIFQMCADGRGLMRTARVLNNEKIPNPTGQVRNGSSKAARFWSITGIRAILHRQLYRGQVVYGATQNAYRQGRRIKIAGLAPVTVARPDLQIVPESLWQAAHARLGTTRRAYVRRTDGQLVGHPDVGIESRYLLSGFLRCGLCGGNLIISKKSGKRGRPQTSYICATRRSRGDAACTNRHGIPAGELTDRVLAQLRTFFLNPATLGGLVMRELAERRAQPDVLEIERRELAVRLDRLDQEIGRFVEAIGSGTGPSAALVAALTEREGQRLAIQTKLAHLTGVAAESDSFDLADWLEETRELLDDIRQTLEAAPAAGRQILRRLLVGPITVTPSAEGFEFAGQASFARYPVDGSETAGVQNHALTGHIGRRVQKWCPRGDSFGRHDSLLRALGPLSFGGRLLRKATISMSV
jgi:DNA invertase Pin-like site-specific DNA recombinase